MRKNSSYIYYLLIFVICFAVYANTFYNGWTYDDMPVVVQNSDSQSWSGFWENHRPGRPMRELTYILEYKLFGTNSSGYHLQQLLWHASNTSLLMLFLVTLQIPIIYAFLASILFLIHPIQVETVANISHRKELLPLFFAFISFFAYRNGTLADKTKQRISWVLASVAGYICAILSNETAITFPAILILYDYIYVNSKQRILLKRPAILFFISISLAFFLLYRYKFIFSYDQLLSVYAKYSFIASQSILPLWMADLKAFIFYLYKIILPINLAPEYQVTFSEDLFQPVAYIAIFIIIASFYFFFRCRKSLPEISFAIGWFYIFYLPVSNIIPVSYLVADRYMYLCLPAVSILIAKGVQYFDNKKTIFIFCTILCILSISTIIQNSYWKDEVKLWRHALTVNPNSTWIQETVAVTYLLDNNFEKARFHAKKAIELNRYNTHAYYTLAKSEDRLGNTTEAIKQYELFISFGFLEFQEEVNAVKNYLPYLKRRALNQAQKAK